MKIVKKIRQWFIWNFKTKPLINKNCDAYEDWVNVLKWDETYHIFTAEERKRIYDHMNNLMEELTI